MSVRHGALECKEPGCNVQVATGKVTDSAYVFEIKLDSTVTEAPVLGNGMGVGDFYGVAIQHCMNGDTIEHRIVSKQQLHQMLTGCTKKHSLVHPVFFFTGTDSLMSLYVCYDMYMEFIKSDKTVRRQNSETCTAVEYEFDGEKDINGAIIELTGRYPESGSALNEICKELVYVVDGSGTLTSGDKICELAQGDMALIQPGDQYYFDGELTMLISSSPAWYPEQYRNVVHHPI